MLKEDNMIQCGWCKQKKEASKWEEITKAECKSREMRRAYTSVLNEKTFKRESNTFYKCPECGQWSRGCQLKIVDTDDERLLKLGGQPIIK